MCFINLCNYNLKWFTVYFSFFYITSYEFYSYTIISFFLKTKNLVIFISDTTKCLSINVPIYYSASSAPNSVQGTAASWTDVVSISDFGWYCECFPFPRNQITAATWAQHPTMRAPALHSQYQPTSGLCGTSNLIFIQRKYVLDDVCLDWIFPLMYSLEVLLTFMSNSPSFRCWSA